jgi:hypothetical protein
MQLAEISDLLQIHDRAAVGSLLFRLQREEWLDVDMEPLQQPDSPTAEALPGLLACLSSSECAVLSTNEGFAYAHSGCDRREAEQVAAAAASTGSLLGRFAAQTFANARSEMPYTLGLLAPPDQLTLLIGPLPFCAHGFHVTLGPDPQPQHQALVQLVTLLACRYPDYAGT